MFGHCRLDKEGRTVRIDARCQQSRREIHHPFRKFSRIILDRDGVVIDDAKEAFILVLQLGPVLDCSQVISHMDRAAGLDPGKDPSLLHPRVHPPWGKMKKGLSFPLKGTRSLAVPPLLAGVAPSRWRRPASVP